MGNYSFKWCLKKPKPTKRTQKPPTVFHEQVCFLSFYPVTWWKLWFGFLFLTEMLVFDTLLLYKLTKAAHCNEVMESQGMKMKHRISYFSIVISPCFQGISEAVLLGGGVLFVYFPLPVSSFLPWCQGCGLCPCAFHLCVMGSVFFWHFSALAPGTWYCSMSSSPSVTVYPTI